MFQHQSYSHLSAVKSKGKLNVAWNQGKGKRENRKKETVLIIFPNTMSQSLAVEPPTGGKNMRAPRQVRVTCTMILKDGKPVCRGAGAPHLPRSNGVSWAGIARNPPPERSNPLNGENLIYQVRELRRNPPAVMRCTRRLSHLWCSSLSGGTADGEKDMRASRPQTPRQVRITCTSANRVCRFQIFH